MTPGSFRFAGSILGAHKAGAPRRVPLPMTAVSSLSRRTRPASSPRRSEADSHAALEHVNAAPHFSIRLCCLGYSERTFEGCILRDSGVGIWLGLPRGRRPVAKGTARSPFYPPHNWASRLATPMQLTPPAQLTLLIAFMLAIFALFFGFFGIEIPIAGNHAFAKLMIG